MHFEMNILKVRHIFHHSVLRFVQNCVMESPVTPFENYFITRDHIHDHNTRNKNNLITQRARTEMGRSTTHYIGAQLWNNLQSEIIESRSKYSFKAKLFRHFISFYQNE